MISYDGDLWSPIFRKSSDPAAARTDMAEFLESIADGSQLDLMENRDLPRDKGAVAAARKIIADRHGSALASATRRIQNNFLIYEDAPFVRTGAPIFVRRYLTRRTWEIDIEHAPVDRAIERNASLVGANRCQPTDEEHLMRGPMWLPQHQTAAEAATHTLQTEMPSILAIAVLPAADLLVAIRIDAILRQTMDMFGKPFTERWDARNARGFHRLLRAACRLSGRPDAEISSRRFEMLKFFFEHEISETHCSHMIEVKQAYLNFLSDVQRGKYPDPRLGVFGSDCGLSDVESDAVEAILDLR